MTAFLGLCSGRFSAAASLVGMFLLSGTGCQDITSREGGSSAKVLWKTPVQGKLAGSGRVPATDGQRIYATGAGVAAFDAQNGAMLWQSLPFTASIPTFLSARDGQVFFAEAVAVGLDAQSGRERWRFKPDGDASLSQSAVDDQAFYFGTDSRNAYAVRVSDGTPLWSTRLGSDWQSGSWIKGLSVSGDTVYAAVDRYYSQNGYYSAGVIVALDRTTGRELWRYQNGDGSDSRGVIGAPTVAGRLLLSSDHKRGAFFAVDRFTGQEVWRVATEAGFGGPDSPPVALDGVAYASGNDTYVYALDLESGKTLWKTRPAMGGSVYHAVCGNAVFNNFQGLGVVDRHNGRLLGLMFDEDERVTSGFAVHDGRIFFVTHKAMYALKCP